MSAYVYGLENYVSLRLFGRVVWLRWRRRGGAVVVKVGARLACRAEGRRLAWGQVAAFGPVW